MNIKLTKFKSMILILSITISLFTADLIAQVNTGGKATTANHNKQVIGYITNWDAWKSNKAGLPAQGALTHLNIDYSKYSILNYSFFGVANDGSLHSGDFRNKQIYQPGAVQQPADIFFTDIYSSWDLHLLFGEIDPIQYISTDAQKRAEAQGFLVEVGGTSWHHPAWGLSGDLPVPLHKENGAPGLLELAHKNDVKVVAAIGGWSMCKHFPEMAADPVKRKRFIDDCVKLINTGFDGIDLDWEYPGPFPGMNFTGKQADYKNFLTLVTEIRAAIGPDKLITAAFSASAVRLQGFDWKALNKVMDYFNFMTYDFNGGWSNIAGHNSPLNKYTGAEAPDVNWTDVLKELNSIGVPSEKISMGTAFYGRGVICDGTADLNKKTVKRSETVQPDGPITTCADFTNWARNVYDGTPHYFYILQKTGAGSGWTRHWDNEAKVPYMTKGKYFLSYDNEESIGTKAQFIIDNNLAGTIIWTVFGDLEFGGTVTNYGTKLKRWSDVKSPLVNKINEVFAQGTGNLNPTCSISSPNNGQNFNVGEVVKIKVSASDKDGTIKKVQYYVDGELKFTDKTSPYVYKLKVANGTQSIKATAIDNEGAKKESQTIKITGGSTGNEIPMVKFVNPSNNSTFNPGESISIKVNASDSDGSISKIELLNGTLVLSTATKSPLSYQWKNAGVGSHKLTARVTDNKNASNTAAITISVKSNQSTTDRIPRVVGYVTSWQGDLNNIDFSQLTHVNYSFAIPTANGTIEPIKNTAKLKELVKKAHAENVNVLVAVGGWELGDGGGNDSRFETLAASASTRKTFVNTMMDLVRTYNLDGIDIDWEYPDPDGSGGPEKNFTLLMKELATALHAEGKLLSAAVVAKGWTGNGVGVEVFDAVDYLNLMAYDGGNGEYHSPYSLAVQSLDFWTGRGLPKNKTVLGVPFYGRPSWKSYAQLISDGADPFADKFNEVYYNGINTIKSKSELALKRGSGVMIWELGHDVTGKHSLLKAISDVVLTPCNGDCPPKITITEPTGSVSLSQLAPITISATVTDDKEVTSVKFKIDGKIITPKVSGNVYSTKWTPSKYGEFLLTIEAKDNDNLASTKTSTITLTMCDAPEWSASETYVGGDRAIYQSKMYEAKWWTRGDIPTKGDPWKYIQDCGNVGDLPPVVSISKPANNTTFKSGDNIIIKANASDDESVSMVEFYANGDKIGEDATEVYKYVWKNASNGNHVLTAVAIDNNGNKGYSEEVHVNLTTTNVNTPPTISITSPSNNAEYSVNENILIITNSSDSDGTIDHVELFVNDNPLAVLAGSPYSYTWSATQAGAYKITAIAYDDDNAASIEAQITINVNETGGCDYPMWQPQETYVKDDYVQYNGVAYRAKWWTKNENPKKNSTQWAVWENLGLCTKQAITQNNNLASVHLAIKPNPVKNELNIELVVSNEQKIQLIVHDMQGKFHEVLLEETLLPGKYQYSFNASKYPNGVYFVKLQTGNELKVIQISKE